MHVPPVFSRARYARTLAAGCVALAAGGIVLLRAPRHAPAAAPEANMFRPVAAFDATRAPRIEFHGPGLHGAAALSQGAIEAGGVRHVYAQVTVTGDDTGPATDNRPVAMAVVLDTSGSMSGDKIAQARNSVLELVNRMRDNDQIAFVTYSDAISMQQPLARVGDVRDRLRVVIPTIQASGGTMIPSALAMGATALANASPSAVRRVVLVSDGQDGSGVALTSVASQLRDRANLGVTLSALGIGGDFDEHFMTTVADAGRGNYDALRTGGELAGFLTRELQQATNTAAERVVAEVTLPSGWHLDRAYGVEAEGASGTVRLPVGALSRGDERRVMLDLSVDSSAQDVGALALNVSYSAAGGSATRLSPGVLPLRVVASAAEADASRDVSVFAEGESAAAAARQSDAVAAWNRGDTREAERLAQVNVAHLRTVAAAAPAPVAMALNAQMAGINADVGNFRNLSNHTEAGRVFGLQARATQRRAMQQPVAAFAH